MGRRALTFLYFPNLGKARKLKLRIWSAFMLLSQSAVEHVLTV